jgi:hypothetical protein
MNIYFVTILDISLMSWACTNDHIIFNVGTPNLETRNIRLVNIITSNILHIYDGDAGTSAIFIWAK